VSELYKQYKQRDFTVICYIIPNLYLYFKYNHYFEVRTLYLKYFLKTILCVCI